jgi:threonylcarbamoyladenosine tRNA methylthiotransferase MtaB
VAASPETAARVRLVALGCRVSRADSEALAARLGDPLALARDGAPAELVVVHTCAVTADADATARQAIRRAGREHPGARIVVAGCGAATCPDALAALPGVAAVIPPRAHDGIPVVLARLAGDASRSAAERGAHAGAITPAPSTPPSVPVGHARPLLKVQDGCDRRCAYCLVPLARGRSRSVPLGAALERLAALGARHPEVVLTGVHLGAWGRDLAPRLALADLLRGAARGGLVHRLRLSSVEPDELPAEVLREPEAAATLCEHLHLPVQSGSDRILRDMRRPGGADALRRAVEAAFGAWPRACLGTDLVAGFPGETDRDHAATLALVRALPLAYLHVFPFSPRPGTPAAAMAGAVPRRVIAERVAELRAASDALWRGFLDAQAGRTLEVVVERSRGGWARGTAREYATVRWPSPGEARGALVRVRVKGNDGTECVGARAERFP